MEPDFKKQSLDKIDDNIVNTWEDIKEVYTNQALRSCLNIYAVNTGLVEWLKETANGKYIHLQMYVFVYKR